MRNLIFHRVWDFVCFSQTATRKRQSQRGGAAAVEFAVVAPLLILIVLGVIEFSRAMMVNEMLNNAARSGCRAGTITGSTNTRVSTVVGQCLPNMTGSSTTITVNGSSGEVSSASRGDIVSVEVSLPYSSVSWLPKNRFLANATLRGRAVMFHE